MNIRKKTVSWFFLAPLIVTLVLLTVSKAGKAGIAGSKVDAVSTIWYTQIGAWHLVPNDSPGSMQSNRHYLFHDARSDGARSGEATANVRLNTVLKLVRYCEFELSLGPAQSTAGLLLQNKQLTLLFLAKKNTIYDSLLIYSINNRRAQIIGATATSIADTTKLTVYCNADSLWFGSKKSIISIARPEEFAGLTAVGFECQSGSVKVFSLYLEAANTVVNDSFDHAILYNLHLDNMLLSEKRSVPQQNAWQQ